MHFISLPPRVPLLAFGLVCGGAFWRGGWPERATAAALLVSWVLTLLLRDRSWSHPQWAAFVIDLAFGAFILALALKSDRYWPLWAAGFHLLAIATHFARQIDPTLGNWAYVTANVIWTYLVLGALAVGVTGAARARAAGRSVA